MLSWRGDVFGGIRLHFSTSAGRGQRVEWLTRGAHGQLAGRGRGLHLLPDATARGAEQELVAGGRPSATGHRLRRLDYRCTRETEAARSKQVAAAGESSTERDFSRGGRQLRASAESWQTATREQSGDLGRLRVLQVVYWRWKKDEKGSGWR